MRWLFRIGGALAAAIVLLLVALLVLPFVLPGEKIAQIAADQVKARTGRDLTFSGDVSFTFWPVLGVTTGPVSLGNADWAGPEPMLRAQALTVGLAAPDLLRGAIRITEITAQSPDLHLATNAEGRGNWVFGSTAASAGTGSGADRQKAALPVLEKLNLANARLTWSPAGGEPLILDGVDLALDWPDRQGPARLAATMRQGGAPVDVIARIARFDTFLAGDASAIMAEIDAAGGRITFDGRAALGTEAAGRVRIDAPDTARLMAALGISGVKMPKGLGRAAQVSAEMRYSPPDRIALRDLSVDLDGNRLSGAVDVALAQPPRVTGRIDAGVLDLRGAMVSGSGGSGGSGDSKGDGWSEQPIDASALGLVNGSLDVTAQGVRTDTADIGPLSASLSLDNARAVLDLAEAAVFGGSLAGQLVANNRSGFSVRANVTASGIDTQMALRDLAGIERLSGRSEARIEVLGSGNTEAAIMRSLSGSGSIAMARGVISGLDLDRLMRGGATDGGTTVFDSLNASFTIRDGDLFNDDLLLSLPNYRADGEGRIGIGARDIDYVFTPVALRANAGAGLRIPIRIRGPWADPNIKPDVKTVLEQEIGIDRDGLEARAKDKLREKLRDELNLDREDHRDPVEHLKDRLEGEVRKGLLRLLRGD